MPKLTVTHNILAIQDAENSSNPTQRFVDWKRLAVLNLNEVTHDRYKVEAGGYVQVQAASDGGVLVPDTETYTLQPHPSKPSLYQARAVGTGLDFLGTTLAAPTASYSFQPNGEGTTLLRCNTVFQAPPANQPEVWVIGGPLAGLARGDHLYVPGPSYGDSGPFAAENSGFWEVLTVGAYNGNPGSEVRLQRIDPNDCPGIAETVIAVATTDLQRVNGVWPYKKALLLASGSSLYYAGIWDVEEAGRGWFAIRSSAVLPTVVQASFERLYLARRSIGFLRVESDRLARVDYHSAAGPFEMVIHPTTDGDPQGMGWFESSGFMTGLTIRNLSAETMMVNVVVGYDKSVA